MGIAIGIAVGIAIGLVMVLHKAQHIFSVVTIAFQELLYLCSLFGKVGITTTTTTAPWWQGEGLKNN